MADASLVHAFVSALSDEAEAPGRVRPSAWNAEHALSGGGLGDLLYRDTASPSGAGWLPSVAVGSVLVSGGDGVAPAWSATPTLTSLTLTNRLGIGTTSPDWPLHVVGSVAAIRRYGGVPQWITERWGGTPAAPAGVTGAGSQVGEWGGYVSIDGVALDYSAYFRMYLDGEGTASSVPGSIEFFTCPIGSKVAIRRIKIGQSGNVSIGNPNAVFGASGPRALLSLGVLTGAGTLGVESGFTFQARNAANTADITFLTTDAADIPHFRGGPHSVSNDATKDIGTGVGIVAISINEDNRSALFQLRGTSVVQMTTEATFSTTKDNPSTVNVYFDSTGFFVQNKRGSARTFSIVRVGSF